MHGIADSPESPQAGIHLLHKPVGATSFSLVLTFLQQVQAAGLSKKQLPVCHGGALDPFAEGLMLLLAGPATRLMELMHPIPKSYVAEVAWGAETDNGDLLGKEIARGDPSTLSPEALESALPQFLGWREQVPPSHSNKRVGGERAYKKAHRGEAVVLPPVRVYLHEARWLAHDLPRSSTLALTCRGGYYVRSLARELGRALGCRAHLMKLARTAIGPWLDPGPGERTLLRGRDVLPWCPSRVLNPAESSQLSAGATVPAGRIGKPDWALPAGFPDPSAPIRGLLDGRLVALLREQDGLLTLTTSLRSGL